MGTDLIIVKERVPSRWLPFLPLLDGLSLPLGQQLPFLEQPVWWVTGQGSTWGLSLKHE